MSKCLRDYLYLAAQQKIVVVLEVMYYTVMSYAVSVMKRPSTIFLELQKQNAVGVQPVTQNW